MGGLKKGLTNFINLPRLNEINPSLETK